MVKRNRIQARLLVDGSNFLGRASGYRLGPAEDRERLVRRLGDYARRHPGQRVVLWFDGDRASMETIAGVEVRFVGPRDADASILDYLAELSDPERTQARLVTDDRKLSSHAKRLRVPVASVGWLHHRLPEPGAGKSDSGVSPDEIKEWLDYFGANDSPRGRVQ